MDTMQNSNNDGHGHYRHHHGASGHLVSSRQARQRAGSVNNTYEYFAKKNNINVAELPESSTASYYSTPKEEEVPEAAGGGGGEEFEESSSKGKQQMTVRQRSATTGGSGGSTVPISTSPLSGRKEALDTSNTSSVKGGVVPHLSQVAILDHLGSDLGQRHSSNRASSVQSAGQDDVYYLFREKMSDVVKKSEFKMELHATGLWEDDPRLKESMRRLAGQDEIIPFSEFKKCLKPNIYLIDSAIQGDFVIPDFEQFCSEVDFIFNEASRDFTGEVAQQTPLLKQVDDTTYGMSLCTIDGQRHSAGDATKEFTLQALAMPILYALCMDTYGEEKVHKYVGHEPSGVDVSEIMLDEHGKPHNPLINGGGILLSSLIEPDQDTEDRFDFVMQYIQKLTGGAKVGFDNRSYLAEKTRSDRNYALTYFMKEKQCFARNINVVSCLDFYVQICNMTMTCESMSVIAGVFANGGICPITGEEVVPPFIVRNCLSVMYSCGMYNNSGEFSFMIGLPAKAAITGVTMVVVPNVMGYCVWSPKLDRDNNSVRGLKFCKLLIDRFNFHNYDDLIHVDALGSAKKCDPRRKNKLPSEDVLFSLIYAACEGDLSTIKRLFLAGTDLNEGDYDGRTALHLAASEGREEVVDFLAKAGVDVNCLDRWGHTPLDDAVSGKHEKVMDILKRFGSHSSADLKDMPAVRGSDQPKLSFAENIKMEKSFDGCASVDPSDDEAV
eukprot:Nk52_evm1s346 gene=Nk52_evmTU1s346